MLVDDVISALGEFYVREGIAFRAFRCRNRQACTEDLGDRGIKHGIEAYVGSNYGDALRIVVVSLDTGGHTADIAQRREDLARWIQAGVVNPHMRGTIHVLDAILAPDGIDSPLPYFAMVNAAKCCAGDRRRDMVPPNLFERCQPFLVGELEVLKPELVITQGRQARNALALLAIPSGIPSGRLESAIGQLDVNGRLALDWVRALASDYICLSSIGDAQVVTLHLPHPSARQGQWQRFKRFSLPAVSALARALVKSESPKGS